MSKIDRREPRFEVIWKARLSSGFHPVQHVSIHNASSHGLRIISETPFAEDQDLTINLICKNSRRLAAFTLKAKVIYCKHFDQRMGYKLGVAVAEPPSEFLKLIDKMEQEGHPVYESRSVKELTLHH